MAYWRMQLHPDAGFPAEASSRAETDALDAVTTSTVRDPIKKPPRRAARLKHTSS
jgi:hypothetical protein